jgi:hypothetical protein
MVKIAKNSSCYNAMEFSYPLLIGRLVLNKYNLSESDMVFIYNVFNWQRVFVVTWRVGFGGIPENTRANWYCVNCKLTRWKRYQRAEWTIARFKLESVLVKLFTVGGDGCCWKHWKIHVVFQQKYPAESICTWSRLLSLFLGYFLTSHSDEYWLFFKNLKKRILTYTLLASQNYF